MLKGRAAILRDPDRLEECANRNLIKFNKEYCVQFWAPKIGKTWTN